MTEGAREALAAFERALRDKDLAALAGLLAEDAAFFWSNGTEHRGRTAVLSAMDANFRAIEDDDYAMSDVRWHGQRDGLAACTFAFRWSGRIDGRPAAGAGRGTLVLRRDGDGAWRVAHEHLSAARAG